MNVMLLIFIIVFSGVVQVFAQSPNEKPPIVVEYADRLIGRDSTNGTERELEGNVRLTQGNVRLSCNRAVQYIAQNRAELFGNVKIIQNTMTLTSSYANYEGNERRAYTDRGIKIVDRQTTLTADKGYYSTEFAIADFFDNVQLQDDSAAVFCDSLRYMRTSQDSYSRGNVVIVGRKNNTVFSGDSAVHFPRKRYSAVIGNGILMRISGAASPDTSKNSIQDTLIISAHILEAFRDTVDSRYTADSNVQIFRGTLRGISSKMSMLNNNQLIVLEGKPVIWNDSLQLFSDSSVIHLQNNSLKKIDAIGNAFSSTRDNPSALAKVNQLSGSEIHLKFNADTLEQIFADRDAKSAYFLIDDGEPDGLARNASDSIRIEISEGKPKIIRWLGGVVGEVFPEQTVFDKESEFYLPGFRRDDSPPLPPTKLSNFLIEKLLSVKKNKQMDKSP